MTKKIIVITGAAGGVGSQVAKGLAKKGHHIVCLGRSEKSLAELSEKINIQAQSVGGSASYAVVDMTDVTAIEQAGEHIKQEFGVINVWINNVGVNNHNAIGPTWELDAANWWQEISLNLQTTYQGTAAAIRLMKDKNAGYILNLGGGGAQQAKPYNCAYSTAKTSIVRFSETVNLELEKENVNIKVFSFNPGFIKNDRTETLVESEICRKYMPQLEDILKSGVMSEAQDSVELIDVLTSGKADHLGGRYFFADDKNIEQAIENSEQIIAKEQNMLRIDCFK